MPREIRRVRQLWLVRITTPVWLDVDIDVGRPVPQRRPVEWHVAALVELLGADHVAVGLVVEDRDDEGRIARRHGPRKKAGEALRLPDLHPGIRVDVGPERDQPQEPGNVVIGGLDVDVLDRAGLLASDVAQPPGFDAVQPSVVAVGQ